MENRDLDKVDLTEFRELLSSTTKEKAPDPNKAPEPEKPPNPIPAELARQNFMLKVYYLEKKRAQDRALPPQNYPPDYFFSALAELVLE